jgi:phosphoadenosine phosphosulfate reductase
MNEVSALPFANLAGSTRESDAIALYAREQPGYDDRLSAAVRTLRDAAAAHPGTIVQATSLGAEDMVITDLIARHGLPLAVGTLETGALHAETSGLIGRIEAHYAAQDLKVEVYRPQSEAVVQFVKTNGEKAMYESIELRKACCGIRKLEPLSRMLAGRSAWVTGLRREQSDARGGVQAVQADEQGRAKINPLVDWTWADVWHYLATHGVPYNPLHDQFMPSIGCAPCTRAIAVGEPFRAGRWWWEDEAAKECGLHVKQA